MGFLDKVKGAAQDAKDKTNEIIEVNKVNKQISQQEAMIAETYTLMGKEVFSDFMAGNDVSDALKEKCQSIVDTKESVEELKKQILVVKNIKVCPSCKTEMTLEISFCPKCGTKQEQPSVKEQPSAEE